jgi:hypothetical protein
LESKERKGPQPIAVAIRMFLRESGLNRPGMDQRVFSAWSNNAGDDWTKHAVPVGFRGGVLTVEVDSSVRLAELKGFHGEAIRARANTALEEKRIRKVVFKLKS